MPLLTLHTLYTHIYTNKHTYKTTSSFSLALLIFPPSFFFLAIAQWQCTRKRECIDLPKWAAISQGQSARRCCPWMGIAHFTWPPSLKQTSGKPPLEMEGRVFWGELEESGPWSGLGRRKIRAPHAAPACTSHSLFLSVSFTHSDAHTHSFSPHMWDANNNFSVLVSQPSFLRQG